MSSIIRLESENVKRIKAVEIIPDRTGAVVIGGGNAHGKSSVLDSITMAMAGKKHVPPNPVRDGEEYAKIVLETEDLIVTRKFNRQDSVLVVESRDGAVYRSPQQLLDKLIGNLSFDPMAFTRMKPAEQDETLRKLVGLDTTQLDKLRQRKFDDRRDLKKEAAQIEAEMKSMVRHENAPEAPLSVMDLTSELDAVNSHNRSVDAIEDAVVDARKDLDRARQDFAKQGEEVERIKRLLEEANARLDVMARGVVACEKSLNECRDRLAKTERKDTSAVVAKMQEIESINAKVSANRDYDAKKAELDRINLQIDAADKAIKKVDADKKKLLSEVKFPVDGLSFDDEGRATFNGVVLVQCSTAELVRVSLGISMALNPKLKVILIKEGSLMDSKTFEMVTTVAIQKGYQVWIEKVCEDASQCTVFIEDGRVVDSAVLE